MNNYREYWRIRFDPLMLTDQVIQHIAHLNSWVRSQAHRDWGWMSGGIESAIYYYKNEMLEALAAANRATVRMIYSNVACNRCGGTGIYEGDDDMDWQVACRACEHTGRVTLRFYETTLDNNMVFHTPYPKAGIELTRLARRMHNIADDDAERYLKLYSAALHVEWQPNQIGIDRTPQQVAESLNLVEYMFFGSKFPTAYEIPRWTQDRDFFYYKLPLGRTAPHCVYCSRSEPPLRGYWCGQSNQLCVWLDWRCETHAKEFGSFTFEPNSYATLTAPEPIRVWLARRAAWKMEEK